MCLGMNTATRKPNNHCCTLVSVFGCVCPKSPPFPLLCDSIALARVETPGSGTQVTPYAMPI